MKKLSTIQKQIILIVLTVFCLFLFFRGHKDYFLTIIHTNDIHSRFLAVNTDLQDCETGTDCLGGFSKLYGFISKERRQDPDILLLDAGDRFSGTYFYTLHKEKDLIPIFQKLNYDAFTLGNHEFDDDLDILHSFLKNLSTPTVCANVSFPKKSPLKNRIRPSIIIPKNGLKIGIIGALTEETPQSAMYGDSVQMKPLLNSIQTEIQKQKEQGVNFHILLSHLGLEKDKEVAQNIPELDLIVGGHSHDLLSNTISSAGPYPIVINHINNEKTLIVAAGVSNRFIGKLRLKINKKGQIITAEGNTYPLDQNVPSDLEIDQYIRQKESELSFILDQYLTTLSAPLSITKDKDYCGESCPIADFITHVLLKSFPKADIALINSGAVRSGLSQGKIRFKNLLQVLPFESSLVTFQMTGKELISYIEHGLEEYQKNTRINSFLHIAGGKYQFDKKTKKITSFEIGGQNIQEDKNYTVLLSLFLAKGGDGFPKQTTYQPLPQNMLQLLSDYFLNNKSEQSPNLIIQ